MVRKFLLLALLCFCGCATKAITKPYSETIAEAESAGVKILSVTEQRELFFSGEKDNKTRLEAIISARNDGNTKDPNYRIGPRDELEINVFDVAELNLQNLRVQESGFISLPLIGGVKVTGKTESELREELAKRLASYVKSPQVSVFISHYGSKKIGVMGAVDKPGMYPLKKGDNSILEMLSEAGGVNARAGNLVFFVPAELAADNQKSSETPRAMLSSAILSSRSAKGQMGIEIYLDSILGTTGQLPVDVPVRGGDMIVVPEAGRVVVDGEVDKPGSFELGSRMSLLGSLAASGGITYSAKVDEIEIIRDVGASERAHLIVDLEKIARGDDTDIRLRNGDIVRVPSDRGRRVAKDTFDGITRIINFGVGGTVNLAP
jgi:polysaccharide export outer membrane protein